MIHKTAIISETSKISENVEIGPFSHLRAGSHIERDVHIGNFSEVKKSRLGRGTMMGHFSYIGDAWVGAEVNIGAGTVTCNFDGDNKNETIIEDGAFIGSDSMLVAPIRVGAGASTGAGSVVNKDVPAYVKVRGNPAKPFGINTTGIVVPIIIPITISFIDGSSNAPTPLDTVCPNPAPTTPPTAPLEFCLRKSLNFLNFLSIHSF